MSLIIHQGGAELLQQYSQIPIAFQVNTVFEVHLLNSGLGGIELVETPVEPYIKDYDAHPDGPPTAWPNQFDLSNWGVILACQADQPIAGATIAIDTPGVHILAGRPDLGLLWDIRVHPEWRGLGFGELIFDLAAQWARQHGCKELKIETQNVNAPACRFYARQGCLLGNINRYGYQHAPAVSHETMLIWYLKL